ncbi:MAG: trigger factor [Anaerolineales bacterium]
MKIETKDLDDRQVQLTIEVPDDQLQRAMRSAARRMSSRTKIHGFRPGKVPYDVIVRRFGDEAVFDEALDDLGQVVYRQALEETELEPYAPGRLDEIVSKEPLVLRYTVPQSPTVELGKYRDQRLPYEAPEVSDEALEEAMEEIRQGQALIEGVDRAAQMGDVILLDIQAELREPPEGINPTLISEKDLSLLISEETEWPFPEFNQNLVGMAAEDEKDFSHTFPKDHPNADLRKQTADFHVVCKEVKSRFLPPWSDDLARAVGDFQDLLDLRINVRKQLEARANQTAEAEYAQAVIASTVDAAEISYPPLLLEEELDGMLKDLARRLESQHLSLEDYLKIEKKTEEELRTELEPQAHERLKRALVLGQIVETEKLEVKPEEVKAEIDRMVAPFGENADKIRKNFEHPLGQRRVTLDLLTEKSIQRLVSIAKGEPQNDQSTDQGTIDQSIESDQDKNQE